ncbi:MAG: hypothetical protein ACTHLN_13185, partial [Tepidisphaeraceae bacterium]
GRGVGLAFTGLIALATILRVRWHVTHGPSPIQAAGLIEQRRPELRDRLSTVLTQRAMPDGLRASPALLDALADEVARGMDRAPPRELVTLGSIRPAGILLSGALLMALVMTAVLGGSFPRLVARQLRPWAPLPALTTTAIDVPDGSRDVLPGQSIAVVADVAPDPGSATLWVGTSQQDLQPIDMSPTFGGRYTATLKPMRRTLIFRVSAGDAVSAFYVARLVDPPQVTRIDLQLVTPQGRSQSIAGSDGSFAVIRGTHVHATITANEPLADATLAFAGVNVLTEPTRSLNVRTAEFFVTRSGAWAINLVSAQGVAGAGAGDMRITALAESVASPGVVSQVPDDYEQATNNYLRALATTQP